MSDSRERGERAKLWLIEHVVELRRSAAERAGGAARSIVPEQLEERVVSVLVTADTPRRNKSIGRLRRCQRGISPPRGHVGEQVVEEWNVRNRGDFAVRIRVLHERVHRVVVAQARLRIANVIELHDVARSEQVARPATDVAGFKRQTLADLTPIREVEAVVVWSGDSLVQRDFDALILIGGNCQRKRQRRRDRTSGTREVKVTNVGIEAAELRSE